MTYEPGPVDSADAASRSPSDSNQVWARLTQLMVLTDRMLQLVRRTRARSWLVPMLCLATRPGFGALLPELNRLLTNRGRQIPHASVDALHAGSLEALLRSASDQLKQNRFGSRPLRLRHFTLLCQLLDADLRDVAVEDHERELARRLAAESYRLDRSDLRVWQRFPSAVAAWVIEVLIRGLPRVLLRVRNWRRMRWFRQHQFEASGTPMPFWSFAVQLTTGARDAVEPGYLSRLLVAAFLRDMAVLYRGNRKRWHRTAYPILLVGGVRETNAGGRFLAAVNSVRNETGDPLLIIADTGPELWDDVAPLAHLESRYETWRADLPEARRRGDDRAWYLRIRMPAEDLIDAARRHRAIPPPARPWTARPALRVGAFVLAPLLVLGLSMPWSLRTIEEVSAHCTSLHPSGHIDVRLVGHECIGLTDSAAQLLGNDRTEREHEQQVFNENRHAEQREREHPDRPRFTVVYLTSLTLPDPSSGE